jgi:hypothetical protein
VRNLGGKAVRPTLMEPVSQITIPLILSARFALRKPDITESGLMLGWPVCVPAHELVRTRYRVTAPGVDLSLSMSMLSDLFGRLSSLNSTIAAMDGGITPKPEGPTASPTISQLSVLAGSRCSPRPQHSRFPRRNHGRAPEIPRPPRK